MKIEFTTPQEWNEAYKKIVAGLVICPMCNKWVDGLERVPVVIYSSEVLVYPVLRVDWACAVCNQKIKDEDERKNFVTCHICGNKVPIAETKIGYEKERYCQECLNTRKAKREIKKLITREKWRVNQQNYRAQTAGLLNDLTLDQWLNRLERYNFACAYCGDSFEVMEHIVPLRYVDDFNAGGTTESNVIPACERCNRTAFHMFKKMMENEDEH